MGLQEQPILTPTQEIILAFLSDRSMYGLELIKESNGRLKKGSVYNVLSGMKEIGWIDSEIEDTPAGKKGPPRRRYRITARGSSILDAWKAWRKVFMLERETARNKKSAPFWG